MMKTVNVNNGSNDDNDDNDEDRVNVVLLLAPATSSVIRDNWTPSNYISLIIIITIMHYDDDEDDDDDDDDDDNDDDVIRSCALPSKCGYAQAFHSISLLDLFLIISQNTHFLILWKRDEEEHRK